MTAHEDLSRRLFEARPSVVPYLTAGYPDLETFGHHLTNLVAVSPAVEVGIPFSDPMADGATIQASSQAALESGVTLRGTIKVLGDVRRDSETPFIAMTYLNPLLAFGLSEVMVALAEVGVAALVIPDLPFEESDYVAAAAGSVSIGLVQLVTPLTESDRLEKLCQVSQGFVYAVTMIGTTGGEVGDLKTVSSYLDRVRSYSDLPVLAGFGIRTAEQVRNLAPHCDGVIVGSAVVESVSRGQDPARLIQELKQ